jgi:peptide/nickel transport system substrate-binding protein
VKFSIPFADSVLSQLYRLFLRKYLLTQYIYMRLLYLFLLSTVLFACQPDNRYAGKQIFRYNIAESITSLDPAFARSLDNVSTVNHLFNGLVQLDEQLKIQPAIAKSWDILDSGTTYRFYLRNDVYFHSSAVFGKDSSRQVVASDFVYSLNRLIDSELISPGKWVMNPVNRQVDGRLAIKAFNDSVVEIKLNESFPPFLGILSMPYCSVVPHEAVEFYGDDFRSNPVGTGPFRFKYWKENGKLVLLKNTNYFERDNNGNRLPYLDALAISFIKDQEVNFLKFIRHEFDYLSGLKGSYKDEILTTNGELKSEYSGDFQLHRSPYLNTEYLGFNLDEDFLTKDNPLLDVRIRKAINYGFDRQKMLTYLRNGIGIPANSGFVPAGMASFDAKTIKGYTFQPDSTKKLLAEAGYPNGNGLQEIKLSTTAEYLDLCEYLQHQLQQFGVQIVVDVNQAATNNEMIANNKSQFFRKSWVADYPDAQNYLSLFLSMNFSPSGPNYTHFSNQKFDSLYEEAMMITNDSVRFELYQQMDQLVVNHAPVVPLFYDEVVRFIPHYISGIGVNPMNLLVLKYAKKEKEG